MHTQIKIASYFLSSIKNINSKCSAAPERSKLLMSTNVHNAIPKIKVANALGVAIIIFQNCRAGIIFQFEVECLPDHVGPGVIWTSQNWIMHAPLHDWSQGYLAEEG